MTMQKASFRVAWRRPVIRINGRRMFIVDSLQVGDPSAVVAAVRGPAAGGWGGEYRVEGPNGLRVFTSASQIACWNKKAGTLPAPTQFGLWQDETRRAAIVSELLANLRRAFARPVSLGIISGEALSAVLKIAEHAAEERQAGPI